MSNNRDFKVKNGIQPTVYHFEGVGTVVSGSEGIALALRLMIASSFSVASQDTEPIWHSFNRWRKDVYSWQVNNTVYQYTLIYIF